MTARFRTSAQADSLTRSLLEHLGLSSKGAVARLAIGRSLGLGAVDGESIDSKGLEIPANALFTSDDVSIWIGLLVEHARLYSSVKLDSMDALRSSIRAHWHRGVNLLEEDWQNSNGNFDQFVTTLARRRADLPETSSSSGSDNSSDQAAAIAAPIDQTSQILKALIEIGISAEIKDVEHGPRLSRYRITLKDVNLFDKLKRSMENLAFVLGIGNSLPSLSSSDEARTLSLDIPRLRETWQAKGAQDFHTALSKQPREGLYVCPAVDVVGKPIAFDLTAAPHLLVGGSTGQGKSVCVHAILCSLLARHKPSDVQLALMDPKRVEFNIYEKSKFLWGNSIAIGTDESKAMLDDLVAEMEKRYDAFKTLGVNNIKDANAKGRQYAYIVACIDELAELVLSDKTIDSKIIRLAQMARAAGIHLILATQRPDAKTFSGLIRSNIPSRIALTVQKDTESKIILDETGAESLLGAGDMIIKLTATDATRGHGYFLHLNDVEAIVEGQA
jgi:DNA segregation ATPase FtsK/SpoIIIE, S-DNA-T family